MASTPETEQTSEKKEFTPKEKVILTLDSSIKTLERKKNSVEVKNSPKLQSLVLNQLIQLKNLKTDFEKSERWLTNKTIEHLDNLLYNIEIKSYKLGLIWKEIQFLKQELAKTNDNIDIFWFNQSYRDIVEKNIDFIWVIESYKEPRETTAFYNYFTIEYINLLDEKWIKETSKKIDLTREEIIKIISKVMVILETNWINLKHKQIHINTNRWIIKINIEEIEKEYKIQKKEKIKEFRKIYSWKTIERKKNEDRGNYTKRIKEKSIQKAEELIQEWFLTIKELKEINYTVYLELSYLKENIEIKPKIKEFWETMIRLNLNWLTIKRSEKDWWDINIDEKFLNQHMKILLENLQSLCLVFVDIESKNWNPESKNDTSSAEWLYQFLTNNWKIAIEYQTIKDWKTIWISSSEVTEKIKKEDKTREVRNTSSYESALNKIPNLIKQLKEKIKSNESDIFILQSLQKNKKSINTNNLNNLEEKNKQLKQNILTLKNLFIKATWYTEVKIITQKLTWWKSPFELNSSEQTTLFLVSIFWEEIQKITSNNYILLALLWDTWWLKELYKKFHHRKPDEATISRLKRYIKIHIDKFENIHQS